MIGPPLGLRPASRVPQAERRAPRRGRVQAIPIISAPFDLQRYSCACGGSCPRCQSELRQSEGLPVIHQVLRSSGEPLDAATRSFFEPRFGHEFNQVRVHTDTKAAESARAVNASAYTMGKHVVFGSGQYAPSTMDGRRLIAHELAHVVQQASASRDARPTDEQVLQNDGYERAAQAAAARIAAGVDLRLSPGGAAFGLQRQAADGGTAGNDACADYERDPESFSIHVARHFVATEVDPALSGKPVSVTCANDHDCEVSFGQDLVIDVFWVKRTRRVSAGRNTDGGRQFCVYSYSCDAKGSLKLSTVQCVAPP